ncbi:hypothetical protein BDW74DRAFT_179303 [Aspergillus multicolor]|uniref:uncharacterized protein n=1 Tax=Aspergillus multicolor TaxID=41759 RepID=UPI003CCCBCA3
MPRTTFFTPLPTTTVYIGDLNKLNLLYALWRCSYPLLDHPDLPTQPVFNKQLALRAAAHTNWNFNYLQGRLIRANLSGSEVDPSGYDAWNGPGAFKRIAVGVGMLGVNFEAGLARQGLARAALVRAAPCTGAVAVVPPARGVPRGVRKAAAGNGGQARGQKAGFRRRLGRLFG